jgi:multidrug efflux system outer membrane protein
VWLTGGDNNIFTQIGLIVLVGLACKNAILIVEFARELELQGHSPRQAAIDASRLRLRPILMTSIAFIMGVVPLVTSTGAGAEMRHAMGIAVFFGMLGVTLFGLFLTPVFYVLLRQGLEADADTRATTLWRGQATIAYEVDLFGRLASAEEAARLDTERRAALFGATLLSLQADVAQAYFLIRELDAAQALYGNVVKLRADTVKLLQRRFEEGDIAELDLARARSELAAARSESLGLSRQRAMAEHALAILLGKQPAEFSLPAMPLGRLSIDVPAGLPSALLERRPDIAAAERAMAAANARVGVARAAWFPRLSLTGALGYESDGLGDLFKYASRSFVFGPLVGTALSLPIFDGGAREAGVNQARAAYVEDSARYRQTVLQAFREVEDNLAQLRILGEQHREQDSAVGAAERAARIARLQYREGAVSYLNVIDAERSVLQQQRLAVGLDGERARSTVNLIRALGGGWTAPSKAPAAG